MNDLKLKKICPLPWLHFSAHLDSTMRICCNTDGPGFVLDNSGQTIKLGAVEDIGEYFNLNYYKNIRSKMMNGEEPEECRKCYQVEEFGGESVRQGYLKVYGENQTFLRSLDKTDPATGEIVPTVQSLDLSLSNKCNLKCIMCSPSASYIIKGDYDKLGMDYSKEFVEGAHRNWKNLTALEKIVPQIAPSLEGFLTTGGEPFLNDEHYKILELLISGGHSGGVNLSYHTNCTVKNERLFDLWNGFKAVHVHLSIDAFGPLNEYIRYQTKWNDVVENVGIITAHPKTGCEVHTTVQALNVFNLTDLYDWMETVPSIPPMPYHIWMDQPQWLRLDVLPPELLMQALVKLLTYFESRPTNNSESMIRRKQIISYVKRAMSSYQGDAGFEEFKKKVRQFESIRKTPPIEDLIPELKSFF